MTDRVAKGKKLAYAPSMELELTQRLLSVGDTYEVRTPGASDVQMTVRGKVLTLAPKLVMVKGDSDDELGTLTGNALNTSFTIHLAGEAAASVTFPAVSLHSRLTLKTGGHEISAEASMFEKRFACKDEAGTTVLEVEALPLKAWEEGAPLGHGAKFAIRIPDGGLLSPELAVLVGVAIHERYF